MGLARKALNYGFRDYVCIPVAEPVLFSKLDVLIETSSGGRAVLLRNPAVDAFANPEIKEQAAFLGARIVDLLRMVAPFPTTVLFQGETGSGKEVAARLLHQASSRAFGPFVAVHLAALPHELIESELFGHTRGAFTGAAKSRKGAFELANMGTLFLDEIGEAPLDVQVKLLRAIQSREYWPVGAEAPHVSDCRIMAATNRDLSHEISVGRFRRDLFYRLSVFPVSIPPLRDRRDHLPKLVEFILAKLNANLGTNVVGASSAAMEKLLSHDWPGNVRELENVLERAVIRTRSGEIQVEHLDLASVGPRALRSGIELFVDDGDMGGEFSLDKTLEGVEGALIRRAMMLAGGNLSEAARLLGLPRSTLYNRLAKRGEVPE